MHYIRFLRPPKVTLTGRSHQIELLFIISTDLGDSLLFPDEPVELNVTAHIGNTSRSMSVPLSGNGQVVWKSGQRVLKPLFKAPAVVSKALAAGHEVQICISASQDHSADTARKIAQTGAEDGLIMPIWISLNRQDDEDRQVSTRKIQCGQGKDSLSCLDIAEDVGEPKSLARHVWDGGVVTVCGLAGTIQQPVPAASRGPWMQAVKGILSRDQPVNVLELGCGVGVLGLGAAVVASAMRPDTSPERTVLMTDLEDAEEQVRSNIGRVSSLDGVQLLYENLDWEDGREARFGPTVASRVWDLIMFSDCTYNVDVLPALVETLSALHSVNMAHAGGRSATKVFLATKPRHSSETEVFDLLAQHQWVKLEEQTIPLPVMGAESQRVELYLFEKS
ncbi:hypothetical protein ACO1O0_001747 [Amphichorda felina]